MPSAGINGTDLFYVEAGDGSPWIMLHGGLGLDHTTYKASLAPLEGSLRLVYVDQRGNGRSGRPPLETITIPRLAEDVDALRAHLGLERVGVMGHSYGGFVALEYATRFPERVSHLIALSTSPGVFEPTAEELAERADPAWITPEVQRAFDAFAGPEPTSFGEIVPAYLRSTRVEVLSELMRSTIFDAQTMARGFEVLAGWSVADKLGRIAAPTLVLCGRYDLFTTPECSKRLSTAIPGAELVWFEHSGHFPWVEEPGEFFSAVKSWLVRHR